MKYARRLVWVFAASVAACASPDPTYYTLQSVPGAVVPAPAQIIEVRRPGLAGYLDRSDVVLKAADYRLAVNSQDRWAEPLADMIGRIITEDLSQRLPASQIFSESGAISADPGLRLELDINRFDTAGDGVITLVAGEVIEAGRGHTPLKAHTLRLTAAPAGQNAASVAACMSVLLGELADRVAADISSR